MEKRTEYQVRSIPAELKTRAAEDGNSPKIEGYFSVFGSNYDMGCGMSESIDPHAFDNALGDDIRALINHDDTLVLGRTQAGTLKLHVDEHGLFGSIDINPNDTDAMNLYARVKRGDVSQCSFGFQILDEDTEARDDGETVHWTIKRVKLFEVSPCTFPAYENTAIDARKKDKAEIEKRQMQAWAEKMNKKLKGEQKNA
jgi:HK97 family phage prohead protease